MHINSILDVEREARSISRRTFRGSRNVIYQKEMHVVRISEAIRKRWDVGPNDWRAKHLRWFLEVNNSHLENPTNYRYYYILKRVLIFQNRWDDFSPFLNGPWQKP
jgi:hypothetical protein